MYCRILIQWNKQESNDSLLRKFYDEMILPRKDFALVENGSIAIEMAEKSEHHVALIEPANFDPHVSMKKWTYFSEAYRLWYRFIKILLKEYITSFVSKIFRSAVLSSFRINTFLENWECCRLKIIQ